MVPDVIVHTAASSSPAKCGLEHFHRAEGCTNVTVPIFFIEENVPSEDNAHAACLLFVTKIM